MDCAAADFDGDGQIEVAVVKLPKLNGDSAGHGNSISIYSVGGVRKAVTQAVYDGCIAAWKPETVQTPYLVAAKGHHDESGGAEGASVCLIKWNGKDFNEVWESDRIDDEVLEMKVCDPEERGRRRAGHPQPRRQRIAPDQNSARLIRPIGVIFHLGNRTMKLLLAGAITILAACLLLPVEADKDDDAQITTIGSGVAVVINGDLGKAEDDAIADAKRNAVEQAVGVFVRSESLGTDYQQIRDDILTRSEGYIVSWERIPGSRTVEQVEADSLLHIKIQARVGLCKTADRYE